MYISLLLNSVFLYFLALFQFAFISSLPTPFSALNILLVFLVFALLIKGPDYALLAALYLGFLSDVFFYMPFGTHMIGFVLALYLTNFLFVNFFTNRSLYAFLGLSVSATVFLFVFSLLFNYFFSVFGFSSFFSPGKEFLKFFSFQIILNVVFVALSFYLINFFNNSFRPVFLLNKK